VFEGTFNENLLRSAYGKLYNFIVQENESMESKKYSKLSFVEAGLTLIVTPKWMFLAPVFNPYTHNRGMPVYADGYAFAGIMNIQLTQK